MSSNQSIEGVDFPTWMRRQQDLDVWLKILCAAIRASASLIDSVTGKTLTPDEVADRYLVAYRNRQELGFPLELEREEEEVDGGE